MTTEPIDRPEIPDGPADASREMLGIPYFTRGRFKRLIKFGIVGGSGVVVNLVIFEFIYRFMFAGIPGETRVTIANLAGILVSIFTNFVLNDRWTWGDRKKGSLRHWFGRMVKYYLAAGVAALVQLFVTWAAYRFVFKSLALEVPFPEGLTALWVNLPATLDVSPTISLLTGIACGMVINFLASHLWAFQDVEVDA